MNFRLVLLTVCQGLLMINNVTFVAINGLVGLALAPVAWMATLPITGYVAGGALATGLVARHQKRYGRRKAFQIGLAVAIASAAVCAWAALTRNFWLLTAATLVAGYYNANGSLYRFAAAELVEPAFKERAISWVLIGGILGGVVGPNLAQWSREWLAQPFAGAYLALMVVGLLSMLAMAFIEFPALHGQGQSAAAGRPLGEIVRQPVFIIATAACAIGYGVMNLLMAATPIAMAQCQHPFSAAALVLEWHVLGMFVPSLFTGRLIKRFGVLPVMSAGLQGAVDMQTGRIHGRAVAPGRATDRSLRGTATSWRRAVRGAGSCRPPISAGRCGSRSPWAACSRSGWLRNRRARRPR